MYRADTILRCVWLTDSIVHERETCTDAIGSVRLEVVNVEILKLGPKTALQYEFINKSVTFQIIDLKLFVTGKLEIIRKKI